MGIKAKILKELQKKPRRLKELKAKLGNDKKVARAVGRAGGAEQGGVCRKGVYAGAGDPKTGSAVECTLVKLAGKFGFARPVQPGGQDIFISGQIPDGSHARRHAAGVAGSSIRGVERPRARCWPWVKENNRFTGHGGDHLEGRLALVPDACPHCPILYQKERRRRRARR